MFILLNKAKYLLLFLVIAPVFSTLALHKKLIGSSGVASLVAQKLFLRAPKTVDFNVNGICNLDCKWCWGPAHNAKEDVSLQDWKLLAKKLNKLGTKSIVFTGGETLLKKELPDLIKYVQQDLGMRTTLSTNGLLLAKRGPAVLPYVNDLGLPLDGHCKEVNQIMRKGTSMHFERVLEAFKLVQFKYPDILLTARTVAARPNADSIPLIGRTLVEAGVDPSRLRWKIYQISPIGPRQSEILNHDWLISRQKFDEIIDDTKSKNPEFTVKAQPYESILGKHFLVYPNGRAHVVTADEKQATKDLILGNIVTDFDGVLGRLNRVFDFNQKEDHR